MERSAQISIKNRAKMDEVCNNRFSKLNTSFIPPTLLEVKAYTVF